METRHLPRTPGVYQIINTVSGKVYVGSAVDLQVRLLHHRRELRMGTHRNQKLTHAWGKYGEGVFEVRVLEEVADSRQLTEREQYWIDILQSVKNGYNIAPNARSQLGFRYSPESLETASRVRAKPIQGFITPEGDPVTILNLGLFCRRNGLTTNAMRMVAAGRTITHKGWTHVNAKERQREKVNTYAGFIDPQGNPIPPVTNLERFSRERGLDPSSMNRVYRGETSSHAGWTHADYTGTVYRPQRAREYPGYFVSPEGERFHVVNLSEFSRQHNVGQSGMHQLFAGKKQQYKGWTYRPESEN